MEGCARSGTSSLMCDQGRRRASDKSVKEKCKIVNGDDLIWSMGTLAFEDYVEPLKLHLKLYQEVVIFIRSPLALCMCCLRGILNLCERKAGWVQYWC